MTDMLTYAAGGTLVLLLTGSGLLPVPLVQLSCDSSQWLCIFYTQPLQALVVGLAVRVNVMHDARIVSMALADQNCMVKDAYLVTDVP